MDAFFAGLTKFLYHLLDVFGVLFALLTVIVYECRRILSMKSRQRRKTQFVVSTGTLRRIAESPDYDIDDRKLAMRMLMERAKTEGKRLKA